MKVVSNVREGNLGAFESYLLAEFAMRSCAKRIFIKLLDSDGELIASVARLRRGSHWASMDAGKQ